MRSESPHWEAVLGEILLKRLIPYWELAIASSEQSPSRSGPLVPEIYLQQFFNGLPRLGSNAAAMLAEPVIGTEKSNR